MQTQRTSPNATNRNERKAVNKNRGPYSSSARAAADPIESFDAAELIALAFDNLLSEEKLYSALS